MSAAGLSVLYITDRQDAPFRYRCLHPCLRLRAAGVTTDLMHVRDARLPGIVSRYPVVVLFRLPWSEWTQRLIDAARKSGAKLLFDVDDLVFESQGLSDMPFMAAASAIVRKQYERTAMRLARTLDDCDGFVGSTPALARAAERRGKPAFVYPNLLHPRMLRTAVRIQGWREWMQRQPIIAYMSGSLTHNEDYLMIAPVLERILRERADALLMVGGFLEGGDWLARFADRVIRIPFQDWRVQPWSMNLARVNLAPLAVVNEFTHAKSALKYHEAGAIGLPTVATPTEPLQAAIRSGENGYLAETTDQWYEAIVKLLGEKTSRRLGDAARADVLAFHGEYQTAKLAEHLRSLGGRAAHPNSDPLTRPTESPDPMTAPSTLRRSLSRAARARAVFGILRRAGNPMTLSRPDLCRLVHSTHEKVELDPPLAELKSALGGSSPQEARIDQNGRWLGVRLFWKERDATDQWRSIHGERLWLEEPRPPASPSDFEGLLVVMSVRADHEDAFARFSWARPSIGTVCDTEAAFPVVCDGEPHGYLVDLVHRGWPAGRRTLDELSFEPLTRPGEYRLDQLVLLTKDGFKAAVAGSVQR